MDKYWQLNQAKFQYGSIVRPCVHEYSTLTHDLNAYKYVHIYVYTFILHKHK